MITRIALALFAVWLAAVVALAAQSSPRGPVFQPSENCMACHNGLVTPAGEDVSIGASWRASMMANSARDPYWMAAVRREVMDHPEAKSEIEHECSICHMPMANTLARLRGGTGEVFANLAGTGPDAALAADGVSCTLCHQVGPQNFGKPESFTGGYVIDTTIPAERRPIFGPHAMDAGRVEVMRSATGFIPTESTHLRESEMCATCHTLFTTARGPGGKPLGKLPEQVPYLEWRHSAFRTEPSCQSCHMPAVEHPMPIASVLGQTRPGLARHSFRGGNAFMLRMLNRYRTELGVTALPQELDSAVRATVQHLQTETADVTIDRVERTGARLAFDVAIRNLTGHKLPTGYPSRRVWLHVTVRTTDGRVVFESGAIGADGRIAGNDNDADGAAFEHHYREIRDPQHVQIYESVMVDASGAVTTGLLSGVRYVKDNRLLPRGFNKGTASADIAVHGQAVEDDDFGDGGDVVRYNVATGGGAEPLTIEVALRFQPIGFRWARTLDRYDAPEPKRFVTFYDAMAGVSSETLACARRVVR